MVVCLNIQLLYAKCSKKVVGMKDTVKVNKDEIESKGRKES